MKFSKCKIVSSMKHPLGRNVIKCVIIFLSIQTWTKCKGIIGRTGRESLKFKMADFDPREVPLEVALDGKQLIEPYTEQQIRDVSPTAAAFHIWVSL